MSSKTPISILQEHIVRFNVGSMPKYDLVQVAGPCHDPTFYVRVTVGDQHATGCGRTKKEAKHAAAKAMYEELTNLKPRVTGLCAKSSPKSEDLNENGSGSPTSLPDPNHQTPEPDDINPGNPIGELQELCVSRYWPLPAYQIQFEKGLPHRKLFSVSCRVSSIEEVGTGKSKKSAKRAAAFKMLVRIRKQYSDDGGLNRTPDGAGEQFSSTVRMPYGTGRDDFGRMNSRDQTAGNNHNTSCEGPPGDTRRTAAANKACHIVKDTNDQWSKLNYSGANINSAGRLLESTKASSGASASDDHVVRGKFLSRSFYLSDMGDKGGRHAFVINAPDSKLARPDPLLRQRCKRDQNECDYIDGGGDYVTVGELGLKLEIKRGLPPGSLEAKARLSVSMNIPVLTSPRDVVGKVSPNCPRPSVSDHVHNDEDPLHTDDPTPLKSDRLTYDDCQLPRNGTNMDATNSRYDRQPSQRAANGSSKYDRHLLHRATNDSVRHACQPPQRSSRLNLLTAHQVETNDTCDLKPSERTPNNCQERWLYCCTTYSNDVDPLIGGKWMIFAKNCYVDEIWDKLKTSVASGHIWQAKVSWLDPKKKSHAIMIFTEDYEDVSDVIRVLDHLEETGVKWRESEIYYKTNYMTSSGVYGGGKQRPWIYRSSDIRERALTGNYDY